MAKRKAVKFMIAGEGGCVDCDTEFLSQYGWKRISEFKDGDMVVEWYPDGASTISIPIHYHKYEQEYLTHIKTEDFDMCISDNHKVPYLNESGDVESDYFHNLKDNVSLNLPYYEDVTGDCFKSTNIVLKKDSCEYKTKDGFEYCFTTNSGFWLARRNGKIFPTGNSGKSRTMQSLDDTYVFYLDTKKGFNLEISHSCIYEFGTPSDKIEELDFVYAGMTTFLNHIISKLVKYNNQMGRLPKSIAFDAVTNLYSFVVQHIQATTKNNYGSWAVDIEKEMSKFLTFVEMELMTRGIDIVFLSHTVTEKQGDDVAFKISSTGSNRFEKTGGLFGTFNEASFINVIKGVKIVHNRNPAYPLVSRSMLPDVMEMEPYDSFNMQERLDTIRANMKDVSKFKI